MSILKFIYKLKMLFTMKYPKFSIFFITIIIAYIIFINQESVIMQNTLFSLGLLGSFISGILYAYSFTSAIATSTLLILGRSNITITGLIAGLGALFGNVIIYKFINHSFDDEIKKLSKEKIIIKINNLVNKDFRKYILPVLAVIVIASPLPDEVGVALLVASKKVMPPKYAYILFYLISTMGIFVILIIGHNI